MRPLLTHAFRAFSASARAPLRPALAWRGQAKRRWAASSAQPRAQSAQGSTESDEFSITCPLFYVNAAPHMGSAYSTISTDVFARFQRMQGRRVRFVVGTDEHGEKIAAAAAARGLEPQAHCDDIVASYTKLWADLGISYDVFVRTTQPAHAEVVAQVLERVWDNDVYKAAYSGWYCVGCEEYKDELELGPNHTCTTHQTLCQHREEDNYFFALSNYQQQLEDFLETHPDFVQPASARNEVLAWVKSGLRDFSISRSAVSWGIPVPLDPSHTVYVWFDALVGYLTALLQTPPGGVSLGATGGAPPDTARPKGETPGSPRLDDLPRHGWPAAAHIIGKDILRFHAVYWPAMLMAAGLPLPGRVFGHGFLTKDGRKMGKSLGNVLDPRALVDAYGADAVRFFFMREIAFGADGDFSEARFQATVNAGLANDLGNLLKRTLGMLHANVGDRLPCGAGEAGVRDATRLPGVAEAAAPRAAAAYAALQPHAACEAALAVSGDANLLLSELQPWTALKKGTEEEKAAAITVLVAVLEAVRIVAVLLSPVTPSLSHAILRQLGQEAAAAGQPAWSDAAWGKLQAGTRLPPPELVFARIAREFVTEPAAGAAAAPTKGAKRKAQKVAS
uniref:methionine--tRNA ligase n=1 Tax=Auxenochlorella protothecoides TaxID=3075 RepID=A0A1D2A4I3_AUXPR